jgi:hypothetical protein
MVPVFIGGPQKPCSKTMKCMVLAGLALIAPVSAPSSHSVAVDCLGFTRRAPWPPPRRLGGPAFTPVAKPLVRPVGVLAGGGHRNSQPLRQLRSAGGHQYSGLRR